MRLDRIAMPKKSWQMLYDPDFAGQISMLDGSREVLGPALFLLGADPNTTDPALLEQAAAMAVAQKPLVTMYDTKALARHILDGIPIVECWDGDVAAAITQGAPGIRYVLPSEGYRVWADAPCIPANAYEPAAAHRFLDYLLEPHVAAANADIMGYQPVVPAADPLVRSLVQRSMRPTDEQMRAGIFLRDLGEFNATFEAQLREGAIRLAPLPAPVDSSRRAVRSHDSADGRTYHAAAVPNVRCWRVESSKRLAAPVGPAGARRTTRGAA